MKQLISKYLVPVLQAVKGKKPVVITVSIVVIAAAIFAAQKGYISQDLVNIDLIVKEVGNIFSSSDSVKVVVDSTSKVVDSLAH